MGYTINQAGAKFKMHRGDLRAAYRAVLKLFEGGNDQRWVKVRDSKEWNNIGDALNDYGYEPTFDEDFNIIDIQFQGEKMGAEDKMFRAIAPFVEKGSYIEMTGDEGAHWRWVFNGKQMKEVHAEVPWEDDDE